VSKYLPTLARIAIAVVLLGATIRFAASDLSSISESIAEAALWPLLAVVGLFLLTRVTDAFYMQLLYQPAAPSLSLKGALRLVIIQGVAALAIPRFGNIAGAAWLKTVHGLGLLRFTGIHLAATLLNGATIALIGSVALFLVGTSEHATSITVILAVAVGTFILLIVLGLRLRVERGSRWRDAMADAHDGFTSLASHPSRLPAILLLQMWSMLARAARIGFALLAITTLWPDTSGVLVASSLADLATLIALTPAGLGLREAAATAAAQIAAVGLEAMLAAVLLDRIVGVGGTLVLGLPLLLKTNKHKAA
jgi:uncharacterized membrane protein YbhN (UPF0104 family)